MTVKSTRKDNGVKPMDVDRIGVMISAKDATCAKVEMTKVAQVNALRKRRRLRRDRWIWLRVRLDPLSYMRRETRPFSGSDEELVPADPPSQS